MTNYTEDILPIVQLSDKLHIILFGELDETELTRERADSIKEMFELAYQVTKAPWQRHAAAAVKAYIETHLKQEYVIKVAVPSTTDMTVCIKADNMQAAVDALIIGGEEADGLQSMSRDTTDSELQCDDIGYAEIYSVDGKMYRDPGVCFEE